MRIFLDASCLFSAIKSVTGGSAKIVEIASIRGDTICVTNEVIAEAKRNLVNKVGGHILRRLHELLASEIVEIADSATSEEKAQWQGITVMKDCHILAGALKASADIIISFDKKHIVTPEVRAAYPLPVMEPRDFLSGLVDQE